MGGGSRPTTTTQIQKTELPKWVEDASQENFQFAKDVAGRPFEQYQGPLVAPLSQGEQAAGGILNAGMSGSAAIYGNAANALSNVANGVNAPTVRAPSSFLAVNDPGAAPTVNEFGGVAPVQNAGGYSAVNGPGAVRDVAAFGGARDVADPRAVADVQARSFLDANLQSYMDPYTGAVVDTTLQGIDRQIGNTIKANSDANRASGAWGGSRDAISNAVIQSEGIRNKAATEAQLRSSAFNSAAGLITNDNQSFLQAALANQGKDVTTNAQRIQAQGMNQNADIQGGQLNAQIGGMNQQKDITGNAQAIDVGKANQSTFLAANAQDLSAQQANQNSALQTQGTNAGIRTANQSSALTNAQQRIAAQTANQNAGVNLAGLSVDAQKANATNTLQGAQIASGAAASLGQLGESVTNTAGKNALLSSQLGANERGVAQAGLDAEAARWQERYDAPMTALNTRLAALGLSPYGKTTTTNETKSGGTSSNGALQGIGAVLSFLPLMFSDKNVKKDVKKLGKIPGSKLDAYEFNYKDSFLSKMGGEQPTGKHVGLMAQDVEKIVPSAVKKVKVGGKTVKAVHYGEAMAGSRTFLEKMAA